MLFTLYLLLAHSFYDPSCCENRHCHPVPCEEISATNWGWIWRKPDLTVNFMKDTMKPSPDGNCHVCVDNLTDTPVLHGICIYLPPRV